MFMATAMAGFTVNDVITKFASESMNMGQVMLIRGVFASIFIGALALHQGALRSIGSIRNPLLLLRVVSEVGATVTFLIALSHLPIANVSSVLQALPLAVTMGAALVYGERVGWRRWLSIAVGFAGVTIIVRPGYEGFSIFSVMALASVFFCAVRDLSTKRIPHSIPTSLISAATALAVTLCGTLLIGPMGGWKTPSTFDVGLLAAAAVLLVVGYQFIVKAMRVGDISFIAPFRYMSLLWAIPLGFIVFGDIPDLAMIVGAGIIVASGIYMLYRERVVGRARTAAESTSPTMAPDGI